MSIPATTRFSRDVLIGAGLGAALAGVLLLVGALRATVALVSGVSIAALTAADVRMVAFYVLGFAMAGAFVGALRPVLRSRGAITAALAVGGAIVMNTIAIADQGWDGMDRIDWIAMTLIGAILGVALALGYLKRPAEH